jgi:hypothetical protein
MGEWTDYLDVIADTAGSVLDVIDGDYARVTLGALRQKETLSSQLRRS